MLERRGPQASAHLARLDIPAVPASCRISRYHSPVMSAPAPAVFMDRDGTLIEEAGYLDSLDRLTLLSPTVDAPRLPGRAGERPTDGRLADAGQAGGTVGRPGRGRNADTRPAAGWIVRQGR